MGSKWRSNLEDAVLLDPLVLVHGNCKDVFLLSPEERTRLPASLKQVPAMTMEVVLALELEAAGMDAVVLYDPVSGLRVMRGSMHPTVQQLLTSAPGSPVQAAQASANTASGSGAGAQPPSASAAMPALPRAIAAPPPGDGWMVQMDQQYKPIDFLRVVQTQLFANPEIRVGVICQFVDRYLPF
jgi:hypothetical protein